MATHKPYKPGDRVWLRSFWDGNVYIPYEEGEVQGDEDNGVYLVEVDDQYLDGPDDDGLREVPTEQIGGLL